MCIYSAVDTPDPYVVLRIPGSSNPSKRTSHVDNCTNPIWDETFHFYLDPSKEHILRKHFDDSPHFSPFHALSASTTFLLTTFEILVFYQLRKTLTAL